MDDLACYVRDPVAFIDDLVERNELGQLFALLAHQREILRLAFAFDAEGRLPWETVILSQPKKSGKTTLNALLTLWWAFTQEAPNDLYLVANDYEQAAGRVFRTLAGLLRHNPHLATSAEVQAGRLLLSNGTTVTAIASEYAGAAGSNHGLTSWDELWGYVSERSHRLWEELTPVATRTNSIRLVTTYAGFEGESKLLRDLYLRGVGAEEHPEGQGARLHPALPVYGNAEARTFIYWDHEPRMPWQTARYYEGQRRALRAASFIRLHENRWTVSETVFITPELWDSCVDADRTPLLPTKEHELFLGVDAATKNDTAAVVGVRWEGDKLAVTLHRIWQPRPGEPLDLEATVEAFVRDVHAGYRVREVLTDPFQMARSIATLKAAGVPMREFPQTVPNTTLMGATLWDLVNGRNLRCYPAESLRTHLLNCVGIETSRGMRIAKEKSSRKIDAAVALSMACGSALEHGRSEAPVLPVPGAVETVIRDPEGWPGGGLSYAETYDWLIGRR